MDAAAPGDTVLVLPGTYVIDNNGGGWPSGVDIGPDKPGLKLRAGGPPGSVKIVGVGTIVPGPLNWRGISVEADNALVEGFDISGLFQTGITAGASVPQGTRITGNTIHDLQTSDSSLAIGITPGPGNEVDHNTIYGCVWGIMLNGPGKPGPDWQTHLHHNQVSNQVNAPSLQAAGIGIFLWLAPGCQIDHNDCNDDGQFGIYLASSPRCIADSNSADGNGDTGIFLDSWGSPDCTLANNQANGNGGYGIVVGSSSNCALHNNQASHNHFDGIMLVGSSGCAVDNNATNDNGSDGIRVDYTCGSTFKNNAAEGNGEFDLGAPALADPACNTYLNNRAGTATPSLALWNVK